MTNRITIPTLCCLVCLLSVPAVAQTSSLMQVPRTPTAASWQANGRASVGTMQSDRAAVARPDYLLAQADSSPSVDARAVPFVPSPPPPMLPAESGGNGISTPDMYGSGPYMPAPPYIPSQGIALNDANWMYQPAPPVRTFSKNDVVTIRVDEITRMMAEGLADNRKRTLTEAILTDWIRLKDFRLRPDPQEFGDPAVAAESNKVFRAESFLQSRESLAFNIAATVVDIRPNGNLVLEARKSIRVNDNLWETALTGDCRAQDIGPDNVVLSKDLINLEIRKDDQGQLRDGYNRGWLKRFVDRYGPF